MNHINDISEKIKNRTAKIAVIGLGYVGLPLAVEIAKTGFETTGFDVTAAKVDLISGGENYIKDVNDEELKLLVKNKKLSATKDFSRLKYQDFVSICVPTPLGKGKNPDMSFIIQSVEEVKKYLHKNQVIILESTTYPGTTEEVVLPILEESGLKVGQDFHLAFSPERIDPGNKNHKLHNTPKVIGGITPNCTEMAQLLYQTFIEDIIPVSSTRAAEMVKLLENTFRAINIGLANETSIICAHLGIDTWEVIEAAATKPFGFMPFYPGPGLGGHCIPVDPHYLVWKLKSLDYHPRFIQLADEINSYMPHIVVDKITEALNNNKKSINDSKVLILGITYKKDIDDVRESPSIDVIRLLKNKGAKVDYHDPMVPNFSEDGIALKSCPISNGIQHYDCVALLTDHSAFNIKKIVQEAKAFVDTRNVTKGLREYAEKIIKI